MPHAKQRKTQSNKKKNKPLRASDGSQKQNRVSPNSSSAFTRSDQSTNDDNNKKNISSSSTMDQGMYQTYKQKTQSFRDRIQKLLPKSTTTKLTSVSDLSRASDIIFHQAMLSFREKNGRSHHDNHRNSIKDDNQELSSESVMMDIPHEIIQDLNVSIRLRTKVGKKFATVADAESDDEGHTFMLDTLEYCRQKLKHARAILNITKQITKCSEKSNNATGHDDYEEKSNSNRFEYLVGNDDDNDDEEDNNHTVITEKMVREGTIPDVSPPKEPEKMYSIEKDLIQGSDVFQACAFLSSISQHMLVIGKHYELLKYNMRTSSGRYTPFLALLECAAVTNMAIESVQQMEAALATDRPHLSTFYDIIAVIFLHEVISDIEEKMKEKEHQNDYLVKRFMGQLVELGFHCRDKKHFDRVVRQFVKKSKLSYDYVNEVANNIRWTMLIECLKASDEPRYSEHISIGMVSHSWLANQVYIGGDRSIFNTQNVVQAAFDIHELEKKFVWGGSPGTERPKTNFPVKKIRGDMDLLLKLEILPELFAWYNGPGWDLIPMPDTKQPLVLMHLIKTHMQKLYDGNNNNRRLPVPISLTFGIHAILVSMFALQGDDDISQITKCAKKSYNTMFEQIEEVSKTDVARQVPSFAHNVSVFEKYKVIAEAYSKPSTDTSEDYAFWNPVVGGQLALFAVYTLNMDLGSMCIDSIAQLRITMHICNVLKQSKLIDECEGSLIKILDKIFDKTRAIWGGSRSVKGEFEKRFLISFGYTTYAASQKSKSELYWGPDKEDTSKWYEECRTLDPILPEHFSASYKRFINRDFSEDIDDIKDKHQSFDMFLSRTNMVKHSMLLEETDVIPVNFLKVAVILHEFVLGFGHAMGWHEAVDENTKKVCRVAKRNGLENIFDYSDISVRYTSYVYFIERFLKYFDTVHDDFKASNSVLQICDYNKAAQFTKDFFRNISEGDYKYIWNEKGGTYDKKFSKYHASKAISQNDFARVMEWKKKGTMLFQKGMLDKALVSYELALHLYGSNIGSPEEQTKTLVTL